MSRMFESPPYLVSTSHDAFSSKHGVRLAMRQILIRHVLVRPASSPLHALVLRDVQMLCIVSDALVMDTVKVPTCLYPSMTLNRFGSDLLGSLIVDI
jgi:hypothetical protein